MWMNVTYFFFSSFPVFHFFPSVFDNEGIQDFKFPFFFLKWSQQMQKCAHIVWYKPLLVTINPLRWIHVRHITKLIKAYVEGMPIVFSWILSLVVKNTVTVVSSNVLKTFYFTGILCLTPTILLRRTISSPWCRPVIRNSKCCLWTKCCPYT